MRVMELREVPDSFFANCWQIAGNSSSRYLIMENRAMVLAALIEADPIYHTRVRAPPSLNNIWKEGAPALLVLFFAQLHENEHQCALNYGNLV